MISNVSQHAIGHMTETSTTTMPHGNEECAVLSGFFALSIQCVLLVMSFLTLIVKWKIEIPPRTLQVFARDSSKQIIGGGVIHCWNLALAILFDHRGIGSQADQCAWYWINIMIDTTIGVGINYGLLRLTEKHFGYDSGKYLDVARNTGDEEDGDTVSVLHGTRHPSGTSADGFLRGGNPKPWLYQISIWLFIVSIMKCSVALLMYLLAPMWSYIGMEGTLWVPGGKDARLVFVMIVTPITMNCFQFWVQDSFLKWKKLPAP